MADTVQKIATDTGASEADVLALVDQLTALGDSPVLREDRNGITLTADAADVICQQLGGDRG